MPKAKTTVPSRFAYFDKYQHREIELTPKPDEIVATLAPQAQLESVAAVSEAVEKAAHQRSLRGLSKANLMRGVAVINVAQEAESLEVARSETSDEFLNMIPAFVDSDGLTRYFVPDEITVQFKAGVSDAEASQMITDKRSEILIRQRTPGYYTISVPEGSDAFTTINDFNQLDSVKFAEASEIGFNDALSAVPNDSRFAELWGLHNTGQTVAGVTGTAGADIGVLDAWQVTRGNPNVVIVVIDTGMDLTHPDLAPNLMSRGSENWDFADNDGSPDDSGSHGSHVCGTAAAAINNGIGVTGVAPQCQLMPLRINLTAGMNANRADAINFAAAKARHDTTRRFVINCSWRTSGSFSAVLAAIDGAVADGALVVFAAGNAANDMDVTPQFPGVHPTAICVAALDARDQRAGFSNVGSQVDVAAPGTNILSTTPGGLYDFMDGTSMAAPHVSGTLALIWSANTSLTNLQVRDMLHDNCDDISSANPFLTGKLGRGRINAGRAVQAARDVLAVPV